MAGPLVLDTSALLAGRPLGPGEDTLIPDAVVAELRPGGRDRRHLDHLLAAGARTTGADEPSRKRVREEAARGGDLPRLTAADVDVIAVALAMGGTLVTDDYTVQNVARRLGVAIQGVQQEGIREGYRFLGRCVGCRRTFEPPAPVECPVCGSEVRTIRDRSTR